jgi:heme/copper-type cytochrome/quinol oxidase subunit 4
MSPSPHTSPRQATAVWLLLVAATLVSWWLVEGHGPGVHVATTVALLIAGFKARMVLRHFMELRSAPVMFGVLFDAWVVVFVGAIVAGYWIALR